MPEMPRSFTDRQRVNFESNFMPEPNSGCWLWTGFTTSEGYGRCNINRAVHNAHRVSFAMNGGTIPNGYLVLHSCDNPCCVNPDHLRIGTDAENAADRSYRRRDKLKITDDEVVKIRNMPGKYAAIAKQFGISPAYVCRIKQRNSRIFAGAHHVVR